MVRVILWMTPRSCSTALERAIAQLGNCTVLHEPFEDAYYVGPERTVTPYSSSMPIDLTKTYEKAMETLIAAATTKEHVFAKEMALCLTEANKQHLLLDFRQFRHVFLTRHPAKATISYYKCSIDPNIGWHYFKAGDMGYRQLYELYTFASENLECQPLLFRTEDLQRDPQAFLKHFCSETGLPFDRKMLSWEPNADVCQQFYPGWHGRAAQSRGFQPSATESVDNLEQYPSVVSDAVEYNLPYYNKLERFFVEML